MNSVRKLFGTDGVRGVAGVDLTAELARSLGAAAVRVTGPGATIAIGRDTRESGPELDEALGEGIAAAGGNAIDLGVLPTPGVAVLAREIGADLGCVISASHNPYGDNGIKFLGGDGRKLSDAIEAGIEEALDGPEPGGGGRELYPHPGERYVDWLVETFGEDVDAGGEIVVDCANGAAHAVAPWLFEAVGVPVHVVGDRPDGRNINLGVGSTHLDALATTVQQRGALGGVAFDGDADRCLGVDAQGRTINGDAIVAVLALDRKARGQLPQDRVVVTSMTNLGFHRLMREHGIVVEVTDVGDRYVVERMLQLSLVLGGEQSGHVIDMQRHTTGDGLATAMMLLAALNRLGMTPSDAAGLIVPFPQRLVAVRADRSLLPSADQIWQEVDAVSENLGDRGRVVLRASGTEPVVRVMVEAEDAAECERICEALANLVRSEIGV